MFVAMYHPDIPSTITKPVEVALQSIDDHAARGWLLVDPDFPEPPPATPYVTRTEADSRYLEREDVLDTGGKVRDEALPTRLADVELRAAFDSRFVQQTVLLDEAGNVKDAKLPTRLSDVELRAASVAAGREVFAPISRVHPALRGLRTALAAGRTTAISVIGDSTGDSDGSNPADLRWPTRLAKKIGAAYPSHMVISRLWDHANQRYGAPVVLQNQAAGRRHSIHTTRSMRFRAPLAERTPVTGNLDLRALIAPDTWTPAASGSIVSCLGVTSSTELMYELQLKTTGALSFRYSSDGVAWNTERLSTVPVPGVTNGAFKWVRVTVELVAATSLTINFYASDDGVTWTQVGTTIGLAGASAPAMWAGTETTALYFGARGWQPASAPVVGKVAEVQFRDGVNGKAFAPTIPEQWERYPDSSTTFGGAPTLFLLNASRSGSDMSYHTDATRLGLETLNYGQALVIFNDGHNEVGSSGKVGWLDPYLAWVNAVKARLPYAGVAVVAQNPHTSAWANEAAYGYSHKQRIEQLARLATQQDWALLDFYSAFLGDSRGVAALVQSDGLHPEQIGYELAAQVAATELGIPA